MKIFTRQRDEQFEDDRIRVERLGQYNSERSRGLLHSYEYIVWMRREQDWFNNEYLYRKYK